MKKLYLGLIILATSSVAYGQYDQSAGLRLGHTSAITYKRFIHAEEALEMMFSWRNSGLQLTGLYQFHKPMKWSFTDRVYLNYGVGGHFGYRKQSEFQRFRSPFDNPDFIVRKSNQFAMGIDAIVGLEYRWLSVPITIALDLKPYFEYVGMRSTNLEFWDAGLSVKYIF